MLGLLLPSTHGLQATRVAPTTPSASPATTVGTSPLSAARSDRTTLGSLDIPSLGLGTIAWASKGGYAREADAEAAEARIAATAAAARNVGLDFFDTAERYGATGQSLILASLASLGAPIGKEYLGGDVESNLARWGEGATVATKFTPTPWRRSAQDVVDACRDSCERLGVDSVPLYQIHMPDIIQPGAAFGAADVKDELYWDGLAECYLQGYAQNVGVSNYGPTLMARAQEALAKRGVPLASNQICFNLLNQRGKRMAYPLGTTATYPGTGALATVEACNDLGVKALAYYPLAMGLLTNKLTANTLRGRDDARSRDLLRYLEGGEPGRFEFPQTAGAIPRGGVMPMQRALAEVAASVGKTPAQVALNWVICKGAVPIAGASTPLQVEENAGALGWRLPEAQVAALDAAAAGLPFDFNGAGFQTSDSKFIGYKFESWELN